MTFRRFKRAFTMIELLMVIVIIGLLISLLLPAVQSAREMARRLCCTNNLVQIGLASKAYEEAFGLLPMGSSNESGPICNVPNGDHMGWIPRILPFIEQTNLYNKIDFSQSVYAEKNQPIWLGDRELANYFSCPSDSRSHNSEKPINASYAGCQGGTETPIDIDNNGVFFLNSKLRSRDIPDGTTNTIFFGESIILSDEGESLYEMNDSSQSNFSRPLLLPPKTENNETNNQNETLNEDQEIEEPVLYFCSLGWMTGTGATLRNTGNPINVISGPFAIDESFRNLLGEFNPSLEDLWNRTQSTEDDFSFKPITIPEELGQNPQPAQYIVGGFSSFHANGANFFMGDGSIRFLTNNIDLDLYRGLGNRNDSNDQSEKL